MAVSVVSGTRGPSTSSIGGSSNALGFAVLALGRSKAGSGLNQSKVNPWMAKQNGDEQLELNIGNNNTTNPFCTISTITASVQRIKWAKSTLAGSTSSIIQYFMEQHTLHEHATQVLHRPYEFVPVLDYIANLDLSAPLYKMAL
jgi:hypothetical protein